MTEIEARMRCLELAKGDVVLAQTFLAFVLDEKTAYPTLPTLASFPVRDAQLPASVINSLLWAKIVTMLDVEAFLNTKDPWVDGLGKLKLQRLRDEFRRVEALIKCQR